MLGKVHIPSMLGGAVIVLVIVAVLSRFHLDSATALARRHAVDHEHFHRIVDAVKIVSTTHKGWGRLGEQTGGGEMHAGAHDRHLNATAAHLAKVESEEELKRRPHPEHIAQMRDPEFHKKNKQNWQGQGFSRPFLLREREMPCSVGLATTFNKAAVTLIRRIIDDPVESAPANFTDASTFFGEALKADPDCITLRLNALILGMALFAHIDRPWLPAELDRLDKFHSKTMTLADAAIAKSGGEGQLANVSLTNTIAKVFLWQGIIDELKGNHSSPTAPGHYDRAMELDPFLLEEHFHPSFRSPPHALLRPVWREQDFLIRRALVSMLFYYEFAPALGAYPRIKYEDTQRFLRDWHVKLDNAIPPYCFAIIVRTYRTIFDRGMVRGIINGYKGAATHESNSDALNSWYNVRVTEMVSRLSGIEVRPTYGYTAGYEAGDVLKPHTDRKACEFTLTTLIEAYPHPSYCPLFTQKTPWAIDRNWIGRYEDNTIQYGDSINLKPQLNQWLILRGRAKPHYRPALADGATCTTFLSHFVPVGEPDQ
jgi:hypothetical protein